MFLTIVFGFDKLSSNMEKSNQIRKSTRQALREDKDLRLAAIYLVGLGQMRPTTAVEVDACFRILKGRVLRGTDPVGYWSWVFDQMKPSAPRVAEQLGLNS